MATARVRARGRGGPGAAQWVALGAAALIILALTFALGLLVGRQWARQTQPAVAAEAIRKASATSRRGGLTESGSEGTPRLQEKLTFYQTLTAPLGAVASAGKGDSLPRPNGEGQERRRLTSDQPKGSGERPEPRPEWTVQLGVFKNPQQAAGVKRELAGRGFAAEVVPTTGDDGHARYRVRFGAFKTKEEAVRAAERIRSDRSLPTFVTLR